jgi:multiple sugar transport system permease protein
MKTSRRIRIVAKHLVLGLAALIGLIPFLLVFITSVKPPRIAIAMPLQWIFTPTLVNYAALLQNGGFMRTILNSLIIAGSATIVSTAAGILAGYAFARFKFRGSGVISSFILFLRLVPPIAFIIPYFLIWKALGLSDTYLSMVLMYMSLCLPLLVWMMRSFFMEIPVEIEEAALVDGCSRWKTLRLILIPAVMPGILASSTLAFIALWNEFMLALINTGRRTRTLPIEIYNSIGYYSLDWGKLSSTAVMAIIPAVLFIALAQKYIVRGLTMGAVKG